MFDHGKLSALLDRNLYCVQCIPHVYKTIQPFGSKFEIENIRLLCLGIQSFNLMVRFVFWLSCTYFASWKVVSMALLYSYLELVLCNADLKIRSAILYFVFFSFLDLFKSAKLYADI